MAFNTGSIGTRPYRRSVEDDENSVSAARTATGEGELRVNDRHPIVTWRHSLVDPTVRLLSQLFAVPDSPGVRAMLGEHRELAAALIGVAEQLELFFPANPRVLELVTDADEGYRRLAVTVFSDRDPIEALDALACFDNAWWLDAPADVRAVVVVDVGFMG